MILLVHVHIMRKQHVYNSPGEDAILLFTVRH